MRWAVWEGAGGGVVMAAKGYPGVDEEGGDSGGIDEESAVQGVVIFHAGTVAGEGRIFANGGRVLNICALGRDVREAQARAYEAVSRIDWPGANVNGPDAGVRSLKAIGLPRAPFV